MTSRKSRLLLSEAETNEQFRRAVNAAIERSTQKVVGWLSHPDPRIPLVSLIRAYDYQVWMNYEGKKVSGLVLRNLGWGLNEALLAAKVFRPTQSEMILHEIDEDLHHCLNNTLQAAGQIRIARHFLTAHAHGLVRVAQLTQTRCVLAPAVPDTLVEVAEYFDLLWVTQASMQLSGVTAKIVERKKELPELRRRLAKKVTLVAGHFIKYSPDEATVRFFHELAEMEAQRAWGWEEFPRDAQFGGIDFRHYSDWAFNLAVSMFMHAQFVMAVSEKDPRASPVDLIPLQHTLTQNIAQVRAITGLDEAAALRIVHATAIGAWNWEACLQRPRAPVPPQYALGDDLLIRSFAGCTVNPMDFLLRELERCYPQDWAANTMLREAVFRTQLSGLLSTHESVKSLERNVWIKSSLGETDIDAVMFDARSGVVGLFQLKWQRMLGADMKARRTQGGNLVDDSNKWVGKVMRWIAEGRMPAALASAGLGKRAANQIRECRVFVVGRHFSRISGGTAPAAEAAWGNWWQIRRLVLEGRIDKADPLQSLHAALMTETSKARVPIDQLGKSQAELLEFTLTMSR